MHGVLKEAERISFICSSQGQGMKDVDVQEPTESSSLASLRLTSVEHVSNHLNDHDIYVARSVVGSALSSVFVAVRTEI